MPVNSKIAIRARFALGFATRHLLVSILIAGLSALAVFLLWYPFPSSTLLNVGSIYLLMLTVDVVCGPLLTLFLANPHKSRRELFFDVGVVAVIQIFALAYGLYSLENARPIAYVFEQDRIVLVKKNELYFSKCTDRADCDVRFGQRDLMWHISNLEDSSSNSLHSLDLSLQGVSPAMRPETWIDWDWGSPKVQHALRPLSSLRSKELSKLKSIWEFPVNQIEEFSYLPLVSSRSLEWIVIFDKKGTVEKYVPIDGF